MNSTSMNAELIAYSILTRIARPSDVQLYNLVQQHGAIATIEGLRSGRLLPQRRGNDWSKLGEINFGREEEWLVRLDRQGIYLITPHDPNWPTQLNDLAQVPAESLSTAICPPLALWGCGHVEQLRLLTKRSLAVVGARASSYYGVQVTTDLVLQLVQQQFTIISGAAYGIDAAAHRAALSGGGTTIAVVAGGVDQAYPRGNATLIQEIKRQGIVLSEFPPGTPIARHRLLERNRIIAALSQGTLVTEAAARSGSSRTAYVSTILGRETFAVPGSILSPNSVGCHELIKNGAYLVTSADDITNVLGNVVDAATAATDPASILSPVAVQVLQILPVRRDITWEQLNKLSGLSVEQLRTALGELMAYNLVRQSAVGYRLMDPKSA